MNNSEDPRCVECGRRLLFPAHQACRDCERDLREIQAVVDEVDRMTWREFNERYGGYE